MLCLAVRHGVTVQVGNDRIAASLHNNDNSIVAFVVNDDAQLEPVPLALGEEFEFAGGTVRFYKVIRHHQSRVPVLGFDHPKHIQITRSDAIAKMPQLQTAQ